MPKKKDDDKDAPARSGGMDPDLEAKRSGPPMSGQTMPKPLADPDAGFEEPQRPQQHSDGEAPSMDARELEQKLVDPSFDPEGHERLRLAEESRNRPADPNHPPTPFVDEHGDPMQPGERHPDRDPEGTHEGPKGQK